MDSMRNLHRSLPRSAPRHKKKIPTPPEDLLQSFKSAALSVTNLYKRAAEELAAERQAGYQDAIYELLSFLDKENIGLETGEGWRIRRWATEKQDAGPSNQTASEEEDEKEEEREESIQAAEENISPLRDVSEEVDLTKANVTPVARSDSPSRIVRPQLSILPQTPRSEAFTFSSSHPYPETDIETGQPSQPRIPPAQSNQPRPLPASRINRRGSQMCRAGSRSRPPGSGLELNANFISTKYSTLAV